MKKRKEVTLLINTCDSYEDILDPFFLLLHRYWKDLPFDIVLSSESLEYKNKYFKIKNVHPKNKKCSWSKRIYEALNEIDTDYVLFFLDDFFLTDKVDTREILRCVEYLKSNPNIVNFTFYPIVIGTNIAMEGYRIRDKITKNKVALIAALWNKQQFLKYLKDIDENIWEFEVNGTIRSNTIYKDDVFYCLDSGNMPIPYDFYTLGLTSGKWFKKTVELFKKEKINFNFETRGIYKEELKGLSRAFISSFKIEPYIIANISEKKYNPVKNHKDAFSVGNFNFKFNIKGARKMVRLTLSEQSGFGVKNFKIEILYCDGSKEIIDNDKLFGSFIKKDDILVFNYYVALMFIPFKNKKAKQIIISGVSVCPLSEELLTESHFKNTPYKSEDEGYTSNLLEYDRIVDFYKCEKNIVMNPKLNKQKYSYKRISFNKYCFKFCNTDMEEHEANIVLCNERFYAISKLIIKADNKEIKKINGLPICIDGYYLFRDISNISFTIPKNTKEITIKFKLEKPFKKKRIGKCYLIENKVRRNYLWKLRQIIKR